MNKHNKHGEKSLAVIELRLKHLTIDKLCLTAGIKYYYNLC
jgi:hypothetical protein